MEELNQIAFLRKLDWDVIVFVVMMLGLIAGFVFRKTRTKIFEYAWLALVFIEAQARNFRDRHWPQDKRNS